MGWVSPNPLVRFWEKAAVNLNADYGLGLTLDPKP